MTITKYQICDHGLEHEQYFQGCGTAFTPFDHVSTGCGYNPAEAISDALESMAQCHTVDYEAFEAQMLKDEGMTAWPTEPNAEGDEQHYYISIRYCVAV